MSAECHKHGCDLVYGDDGMASVCQLCERDAEMDVLRQQRDDLADGRDMLAVEANRLRNAILDHKQGNGNMSMTNLRLWAVPDD